MELREVEDRWRVDDGCTRCVAVHESFTSKITCVTADVKRRIGLRFVRFDCKLSLKSHINHVLCKVNFGIYRSPNFFTHRVPTKLAAHLTFPVLDYCDVVYQNAWKSDLVLFNTVYNRLCRFILTCPFLTHHCTMYDALKWPSLNVRRHIHSHQLIFKCIHFNYPPYL